MKRQLGFPGLLLMCSLAPSAADPWTLERALDHALAHNPDARIAQQRIAPAQAGLEQANSAFWPRLQVQSGYTRTDNPLLAFGSILNQRSYSSSLNFNDVPDMDNLNARRIVTVPLCAGGRNIARRQYAPASTEAAKQESAAVRNAQGLEVSRAFHTVLKTRRFIRATEAAVNSFETVEQAAESASMTRNRLEQGLALPTQLIDSETALVTVPVRRAEAEFDQRTAVAALRKALALPQLDFSATAK